VTIARQIMPRKMAFRDPDRTGVTLSHDGLRLAWLEARKGALNLFVAPLNDLAQAEQLTRETVRSLSPVLVWARTGRHVIIFRDCEGDENYCAYSVDVETGSQICLTPERGVRALFAGYSPFFPTELLFSLNARNPLFFDLVRIDITNAGSRAVFENPGFNRLHANSAFEVCLVERVLADGSVEIFLREPSAKWTRFLSIPATDVLTTRVERLSLDGRSAFVLDSRGRDKAGLFELDIASGTATLLATDFDADICNVIYHSDTNRPLAAASVAARQRWHPVDEDVRLDIEFLCAASYDSELKILDLSADLDQWLLFVDCSDAAGEFRLYHRRSQTVAPLFKNRFDLDHVKLWPMRAMTIAARDGLQMPSYLTLPDEGSVGGAMILAVHGGPYDRDVWGYSAMHQWLASRGYAVLSVNFRGSTGLGKNMINAADQEWGGRMQEDLVDAVSWAVAQGYADPARIGFFGVSYGGYAALMAAAKTPDMFACFIDVSGPSNLLTFMQSIPPYWRTWFNLFRRRLADPNTPEGANWLAERSPTTHAERMVKPILIAQGMQDVRVRPRESEQIVRALCGRRVPVIYVTFADEGHFFVRQPNRIAFAAVLEFFLSSYLGGVSEPLSNAFSGSSIHIQTGYDIISGELSSLSTSVSP
jgi:dipeptidyl aminopeptidase/acylaminoacyl peptidase